MDYLLVSVLPTDATDSHRVISLAGSYRPGTLGAGELLKALPYDILAEIDTLIQRYPYFQALIESEVDNTAFYSGRARPGRFVSVQASRVDIRRPGSSRIIFGQHQ